MNSNTYRKSFARKNHNQIKVIAVLCMGGLQSYFIDPNKLMIFFPLGSHHPNKLSIINHLGR
jgi:hypothetical protein